MSATMLFLLTIMEATEVPTRVILQARGAGGIENDNQKPRKLPLETKHGAVVVTVGIVTVIQLAQSVSNICSSWL